MCYLEHHLIMNRPVSIAMLNFRRVSSMTKNKELKHWRKHDAHDAMIRSSEASNQPLGTQDENAQVFVDIFGFVMFCSIPPTKIYKVVQLLLGKNSLRIKPTWSHRSVGSFFQFPCTASCMRWPTLVHPVWLRKGCGKSLHIVWIAELRKKMRKQPWVGYPVVI